MKKLLLTLCVGFVIASPCFAFTTGYRDVINDLGTTPTNDGRSFRASKGIYTSGITWNSDQLYSLKLRCAIEDGGCNSANTYWIYANGIRPTSFSHNGTYATYFYPAGISMASGITFSTTNTTAYGSQPRLKFQCNTTTTASSFHIYDIDSTGNYCWYAGEITGIYYPYKIDESVDIASSTMHQFYDNFLFVLSDLIPNLFILVAFVFAVFIIYFLFRYFIK